MKRLINDPFERLLAWVLGIPIGLIMLGSVLNGILEKPYGSSDYPWDTHELRMQREEAAQRKWMQEEGIKEIPIKTPTKIDGDAWIKDLENADPKSSIFQEYMEELDNRGIDPGSPRAVEIWETYYK